ncbi:DsbC family protein [Pseudomonas viridiflava]
MTTKNSSFFSASVKGNQLVVAHENEGLRQIMCVAPAGGDYSLVVLNEGWVSYQLRHEVINILTPKGSDPADLLTVIADALDKSRTGMRPTSVKSFVLGISSVAIMFFCLGYLASKPSVEDVRSPISPMADSMRAPPSAQPLLPRETQQAPRSQAIRQPSSTGVSAADGWELPTSVRAGLPAKLRAAAERKLFTVDYSVDHARTLYVFADPECPNCQRLEPVLNTAASAYNVVVFPVAVIGAEKSIASITPVLCLPPEQRKAAWDKLFDNTSDVLSLGKTDVSSAEVDAGLADDAGGCSIATQALGVNEVAYRSYRIPGTPWVITDDGRHVPQEVLKDPALLAEFMQPEVKLDAPN